MANLGSEGERILQKKVGSENKASAFYDKQMLDYLNPYMRKFILKQEMVFIATADSKENVIVLFVQANKDLSGY